jgi:Zn-dependent protease
VAITGIIGASYIAYVVFVIKQLMFTSLVLGFLNLIPVPPLDGSGVLAGILGPVGRQRLEKFRPYGFFVLLLFVLTPVFNFFLSIPVMFVMVALQSAMSVMGFA